MKRCLWCIWSWFLWSSMDAIELIRVRLDRWHQHAARHYRRHAVAEVRRRQLYRETF